MKATIQSDDRPVEAEFSDCVLHLTGEFAGNLDLSVRFSAAMPAQTLLANLRLKLPNSGDLISIVGHCEIEGGHDITLCSELAPPGEEVPASAVPARVEVWWLKNSTSAHIGTLPVRMESFPDTGQAGTPASAASRPSRGAGCGPAAALVLIAALLASFMLGILQQPFAN